jgi:hypothetical protein
VTRDEIAERLREWADVHEKSLDFHDENDQSMLDEVEAEVVLLREAADEIERQARLLRGRA